MDKLVHYRVLLEEILRLDENTDLADSSAETRVIIDLKTDNYQLMRIGWEGQSKRVYHCYIHASIRNQKIWIEQDFTEPGLALQLLERGVPSEDIVLAFQAPLNRPFTGFAVE
jgi:XisI protein